MTTKEIKLYFCCDKCNNDLEGRVVSRLNYLEVIVEPCENCLEEERLSDA